MYHFDEVCPLEIDVVVEGPDTAMFLAGELDLNSREPFWSEFSQAATRTKGQLFLDLSRLHFVDAAGLRSLLDAQRMMGERLVLRLPSVAALRVLELTGLDQRFLLQAVPQKVAYVRRLWEAFATGGAAAMAELVPDQVEWEPASARGQVLHGSREMREFWSGRTSPARPIDFALVGGDVLVQLEIPTAAGVPAELWTVCQFDGDRLVRAVTFEDRKQAIDFAV